ncbi:MAG TPA: rod shape-determining protein MreC [Saprospiraceae bacterium]|nr:rod shape-determining protein MreC [Saprospiraceae bacterium]
MGQLLQLIIRNGGFFTFLLVEAFSFYVIVQYNTKQDAIFTHSMGLASGSVLEKRKKWVDYFSLEQQAATLKSANEKLLADLALARTIQIPYRDTFLTVNLDTIHFGDSIAIRKIVRPQYHFIAAKVIGNTINSANNWLLINRGRNDSLRPDMGVVTEQGVVGIVRHVNPNFSAVMSVLHREAKISVTLKKAKALGSLVWEGGDPSLMTLRYVPKHFDVKIGDEIVTSGFSELFPKGIPVGRVASQPVADKENQYFWIMQVRLSQDMSTVNDVYIVDNIFQTELDSLKLKIKDE